MKKIILQSMKIRNFKGINRLDIDFSEGVTSIYGNNASGKTTIADAFFWLLFDKDSAGRSDFSIKPLNYLGEVADHSAVVEVEAVILVDGIGKTYKKTLAERWNTRRGSVNKVFDGNETERFIDGLPLKKYEFDTAIKEIADEQVFRAVTSVTYFSQTLTKTERRRILFDMTSEITDREMMEKDARFATLIPLLDDLESVEKIKAVKTRERRIQNEKRANIPVRIDELTSRIETLAGIDFDGIENALSEAEAKTEKAREKMASVKNFSFPHDIDNEIIRLEAELKGLEAENVQYRSTYTVPDISALQATSAAEKLRLTDITKNLEYVRNKMHRLREDFNATVKLPIVPEKICPTCGREYDTDSIEAVAESLRKSRDAKLDKINSEGQDLKEREAELVAEQEKQQKRCDDIKAEIDSALALPPIPDMDGYTERKSELCEKIIAKNDEKEKYRADFAGMLAIAESELSGCVSEENKLKEELAKRGIIAEHKRRIDELKEEARTSAAEIEAADNILFLIDDFIRFKVSSIETSINAMFDFVNFKLFDEQINGALAECCEATVGGVPYADLNTASKVNAGMDIINAISEYYGICAPVFVDNAESVTSLTDVKAQTIRLVVSENDELIRVV